MRVTFCVLPTQITSVWHGILVRLLRSLYALALPGACKELQSVEQEVRWRLRRLKYRHLVFLAESSATYMQERYSQELLAELLVHLERRWAEIEDCRMVVSMMAKIGHLSEPLMNRLEDKVLGQEPWAAACHSWWGEHGARTVPHLPPQSPCAPNRGHQVVSSRLVLGGDASPTLQSSQIQLPFPS